MPRNIFGLMPRFISCGLILSAGLIGLAGCGGYSPSSQPPPPPTSTSVTISPSSASVKVGGMQNFTATVMNDYLSEGVTWALSAGCSGANCGGSLTMMTKSSVTYNAPATVPTPAMVTLTATSIYNAAKSNTATITVTAAAAAAVMGTPALAQKKPVVPAHHRELLSGGSDEVDLSSLLPGPSSLTRTEQSSQVGPNIRVNDPQQPSPKGLLGRSETTIAASPDGLSLVAGFNDAQGFCGPPFGAACTPEKPPGLSGFAFSTDGGSTWTDGGAPNPRRFNNVFTRGDPWLDRGGLDNATFLYANLAVDAITAVPLGISVHRGHFSGSTFNWEDVHVLAPSNPNDFFDKEAIAAAKDGSGAGYVSYTNFIALPCPAFPNTLGPFGQVEVFRTKDGGDTYQGPVTVSADRTNADPADPNCGNRGVLQQSSAPAIGPNGEVYVAWQLGPTFTSTGVSTDAQIVVARSLNGGLTFGAPVVVASINSMRQNPPVGYNRNRINDHPRIAVATSGSFKGRVYAVFYSAVSPVTAAQVVDCPAGLPSTAVCIDQNLDSSQVFISFSDDQGLTWSTPTTIAPALPDMGVKRWWPVVNVGPDGSVNVVYYESQETETASNPECIRGVGGGIFRVGTANSLVDTFWVQSVDGGSSFATPVMVTTATSNWCTTVSNIRPNFGDYIGSTTTTTGVNKVLPVWADGRNGVPDTFFAVILP